MTKRTDTAGPTGGLVSWLAWGAVGPAAVALPVNWTAEKLAAAAVRWFKRHRQTDDLSRLVKAGAGTSAQLSRAEIRSVRKLLEDHETWLQLGGCDVSELSNRIAACLPPQEGRTPENSREAATVIARGLIEFAIFELEPENFQKVALARLQQMTDRVSALNKALYDLHSDLYACVDDATDLFKRVIDRLPPAIAGRGEIAVYLKVLIDWLSTDPWPRDQRFGGPVLNSPAIECQLHIFTAKRPDQPVVDADRLTRECKRLVILGAPGSGKTWLAKRTARRCAEDALAALLDGAIPDYIELPLFTTCSRLFAADGDIRNAAVLSAINQVGDLGGSRVNEALRAFFTERNAPTLLVIDSLDEALGSDERLRQADTLPWRILLTSRPSAWNQQLEIENDNGFHQVGQLRPFAYPEDVELFIQRWFGKEPNRGKDLAGQIARNPSLQRASTIPLVLAFYCIVGGGQPLPEFRRHLYARVLRRMLTGRWRDSGRRPPDQDSCLQALRAWAWSATACDTASGVGTWADDILTDLCQMNEIDQEAVGHIAPPLAPPDIDTGKTLRRYIHRSIREHLVAEHIASLPADLAATALLPHLWYDPDWEYSAPEAIAMHPERDQLLRDLIYRATNSDHLPEDLSVIDGAWEFRKLLARVAAESSAADWSPEIAGMISQSRLDLAQSVHLDHLMLASSWETSNHQISRVLLNKLAGDSDGLQTQRLLSGIVRLAGTGAAQRPTLEGLLALLTTERSTWLSVILADAIAHLDSTVEDKRQVREALLRLLASHVDDWEARPQADSDVRFDLASENKHQPSDPTADETDHIVDEIDELFAGEQAADDAESLVRRLVQFDLGVEERRQVRHGLLRLLPGQWNNDAAEKLLDTVIQLVPEEDRHAAREEILWLLADETNGDIAAALASAAAQLDPTARDKQHVSETLLSLLAATTSDSQATCLADALANLDTTAHGKRQVREMLLTLLTTQTSAGPAILAWIEGLIRLSPTAQDKRQACETLLRLLTDQTASYAVSELVRGLVLLGLTADDTSQARNILLTLLASQTEPNVAVDLTIQLVDLHPTAQEKRQALGLLVGFLARGIKSRKLDWLVYGLIRLDLTAKDKRQVGHALLSFLIQNASVLESIVTDRATLVDGVVHFAITAEDRRRARGTLLLLMSKQANRWFVTDLLRGLDQLEPTMHDTREARNMLLAFFATDAYEAAGLAEELIQLHPTTREKRQICQTLLTFLATTTNSSTASSLASALPQLDPTVQDKQQARETLIRLLTSQTEKREARMLIETLIQLDPTTRDLNTWHTWTLPPTTELLTVIRRNSDLAGWLTTLPTLARLSIVNSLK